MLPMLFDLLLKLGPVKVIFEFFLVKQYQINIVIHYKQSKSTFIYNSLKIKTLYATNFH